MHSVNQGLLLLALLILQALCAAAVGALLLFHAPFDGDVDGGRGDSGSFGDLRLWEIGVGEEEPVGVGAACSLAGRQAMGEVGLEGCLHDVLDAVKGADGGGNGSELEASGGLAAVVAVDQEQPLIGARDQDRGPVLWIAVDEGVEMGGGDRALCFVCARDAVELNEVLR